MKTEAEELFELMHEETMEKMAKYDLLLSKGSGMRGFTDSELIIHNANQRVLLSDVVYNSIAASPELKRAIETRTLGSFSQEEFLAQYIAVLQQPDVISPNNGVSSIVNELVSNSVETIVEDLAESKIKEPITGLVEKIVFERKDTLDITLEDTLDTTVDDTLDDTVDDTVDDTLDDTVDDKTPYNKKRAKIAYVNTRKKKKKKKKKKKRKRKYGRKPFSLEKVEKLCKRHGLPSDLISDVADLVEHYPTRVVYVADLYHSGYSLDEIYDCYEMRKEIIETRKTRFVLNDIFDFYHRFCSAPFDAYEVAEKVLSLYNSFKNIALSETIWYAHYLADEYRTNDLEDLVAFEKESKEEKIPWTDNPDHFKEDYSGEAGPGPGWWMKGWRGKNAHIYRYSMHDLIAKTDKERHDKIDKRKKKE